MARATTGPATRKRLTGPERRDQILTAARAVFLASGYSGGRTRDIAERAGVTEALLYRHFMSKEELFEEAVLAPLQAWAESLPEYVTDATATDPDERRAVAIRSNAELLQRTIDVMPLLGVVLFASAEQGRLFYKQRLVPFLDRSVAATARFVDGWARPEVDPTVLLMAGFGLHLVYAMDRHFQGGEVDVEHVAEQWVDIVLQGISGTKSATRATKTPTTARARNPDPTKSPRKRTVPRTATADGRGTR